ncbi:MAG: EamA family transporter RarD [Rectinemataceae bacterium]|nr:EamA family transporter RarD [Spirochaetaceae bacterium]
MTQFQNSTSSKYGRRLGILAAFGAYGMWGVFPLYWKMLSGIDPLQTLAHRVVWASLFCLLVLAFGRRLGELRTIFANRRQLLLVLAAAGMVTANWGLYIYAITAGRVVESALGYYINPLMSVALGAWIFREHVDNWTRAAVGVATVGIVAAGLLYGRVPVLSLLLAITFALYGASKKALGLDPVLGLALETLAAAPVALAYLLAQHIAGQGAFGTVGMFKTVLLAMGGIVTAIPLFLFSAAATSISLQLMGFIQYVSPTSQLLLGLLVYHEQPGTAIQIAFAGVLCAVLIYSGSRVMLARRARAM